ncbi:MAG: PTS transporter subunit EIIC, partial [Clostridia bacterium]|nr:PTS transporter subunit EIIC [Clostridia bacterium]
VSIILSVVLFFVWPVLFSGLVALGQGIAKLGAVGAGIYAFLNRLLIPTGLHHALNNVVWFDTIGLGDLNAYWAGLVEGGVMANGTEITWSVGSYMAGFFPCMMFGIPGAALAMIQTAKTKNRKVAAGIVGAAALCAFICGVTEPFEFAFMFLAFPLYVVYAALYGVFAAVTVALGFRAGFCFSAGATDLVFSASLPAAANTWLILPLGIAAFVVFYLVFKFAITKWDLKTPGREDDQEGETKIELANDDYTTMAQIILEGLGGKENVASIDHCITRLRLEVKDRLLVDEKKIKSSGAAGVIRPGKTAVQIVIGPKVQFVYEEFKKIAE